MLNSEKKGETFGKHYEMCLFWLFLPYAELKIIGWIYFYLKIVYNPPLDSWPQSKQREKICFKISKWFQAEHKILKPTENKLSYSRRKATSRISIGWFFAREPNFYFPQTFYFYFLKFRPKFTQHANMWLYFPPSYFTPLKQNVSDKYQTLKKQHVDFHSIPTSRYLHTRYTGNWQFVYENYPGIYLPLYLESNF